MILQRTSEWYNARLGKFTASCFHELMSKPADVKSAWSKTALKCIERAALQIYQGYYYSSPDNEATRWGMDNEPFAIEAFAEKTGYSVIEAGFVLHPELIDAGATPDALVICPETGNSVPLQVKCHFNRLSHPDYLQRLHTSADLRKMKSHYYCQVQGEIWVTGAAYGFFVSFDPRLEDDRKVHYIRVQRDDVFIRQLEEKVKYAIIFRDWMVEEFKANRKALEF
jgi:hypothetical protein